MYGSDNDMEDEREEVDNSEVKDFSGGISEPEDNGVVQAKEDNPEGRLLEAPDRDNDQLMILQLVIVVHLMITFRKLDYWPQENELTKTVHGSNPNVTMDNWFTSVDIADKLLQDPYKLTIIGMEE
ncbi:hypothetical protein HHI36_001860 [Cryptolaemus montrouzieri]|uniref:PiggyBac transposable element-derived protein domain-containing protein n=1 Tax=Cryptolaemus montrouzieri TaxID=559131 RepID=A0ABD2P9I5_9CUCU